VEVFSKTLADKKKDFRLIRKVLAQAEPKPVQKWQRTFGGANYDWAESVQQTSDGGYILAGSTYSFGAGGVDAYLVKTDAQGNLLWQRTFGGASEDWAESVRQTSDGGYILAGDTDSFGAGGSDAYLIKTDASGNLLWQRTFGGTGDDCASSVQQTSDGGYILAGGTYSFGAGGDAYLVKTDAQGNLLWQRTFGGADADWAESVQQTSDGGYILAGSTYSFGAGRWDAYLVKTDASGNLLWQKTFGGSQSEHANSVQQTSDGGFILAGGTGYFGTEGEIYLAKIDSSGNLLWQRTFEGTTNCFAQEVRQTSDGGYILAGGLGYEVRFDTGGDAYLIKTDASGNLLWQRTFGGSGSDIAYSVQQTKDGGFILAGRTDSFGAGGRDAYLVKTDASGNL